MSYKKGRYLVGFIPVGTITASRGNNTISKDELLKVIAENLSEFDELEYIP